MVDEELETTLSIDRWHGAPWVVGGAMVREFIGEPYVVSVDARIGETGHDANPLLGSDVVFEARRASGTLRVCGVVTQLREGSDPGHTTPIHFTVQPALVALRHCRDSRIFQELSVPEILQTVLDEDLGPFRRNIELRLQADYPAREYCVQYRETDFDFVHRLMAEEGIAYHFEHEGERELMVLSDATARNPMISGEHGDVLRHSSRSAQGELVRDSLHVFEHFTRLRPNQVATKSFDWTHPTAPIVQTGEQRDDAFPPLECYDHDVPVTMFGYDEAYGDTNAATQARLALERRRRDARTARGQGASLALRAGLRFELSGHPNQELDRGWLCTQTEHRWGAQASGAASSGEHTTRCSAIPDDVPWRPLYQHDRPRGHGVQTATVVGPAGEEIHCDPHGRIKVQFHWDRLGKSDENSSCWIRVVQSMGGPGWGFTFIPRIGMEVVVTFVDGDIDHPLVSGAVFNGANPPPVTLPEDKTRTIIRSSSSPGGAGFNALRFEDKAGQEEIWLHGEKDWNTLIKHDLTRVVGNDEAQEVVSSRSRKVGIDEAVEIGRNQFKRVVQDETEEVGGSRQRSVAADEVCSVGGNRTRDVGNDENVNIGANAAVAIGASLIQNIGRNATQTVAASATQFVGLNRAANVVADEALTVGGNAANRVGKSLESKVGQNFTQKVKANETTTVGQNRTATIGLNDTLIVGANRTATITGNQTTTVTQNQALTVTQNQVVTVVGDRVFSSLNRTAEVAENDGLKVGKALEIEVGEKLSFKVGDASITIENNNVTISTPADMSISADGTLSLSGAGGVAISSDGDVTVEGGKIYLN